MLEQQTVERLTTLCQLQLAPSDLTTHQTSLEQQVRLASKITTQDTSAIEPLISPLEINQRLRADEVTESDQRELYQSLAPATEDGLYLVPKVLD